MKAKEALARSAKNLRETKIAKGYTVTALASLSGVDELVIHALEDGDFGYPPRTIYELAACLNVDIREILVDLAG
jgi:transcriptional regulator with XRE-family HTH domain